jgi:acetyl esterase/lipase
MAPTQPSFLKQITRIAARSGRPGTDIREIRAYFAALNNRFGETPSDCLFEASQLGPVKGEWVRVADASQGRVILYLHGGGFVAGSPEDHRALVVRLCRAAQAHAFSLAYRLAPEYAFPAGLRDAIDCYRALLRMGIAPSSIALAGNEAGGGLAFGCLIAIRNAGLPMPAACIAMSPWADLSLSGWSVLTNAKTDRLLSWELLFVSARHYLRKQSTGDPYASPVNASFRDFPPLMVHAGSCEILRDDASRLGEKAAEANIPVSIEIYDGMKHLFQADRESAEGQVSLQRLGQFIRSKCSDGPFAAAAQ